MALADWRYQMWRALIGDGSPGDVPTYVDDVSAPTWQAPSDGGGGAPTGASYVTIALNGSLSNERVLTAGTAVTLTDGGANGNATIAVQLGTTSTTACAGDDARLSDARTPVTHDAQHDPHIMARVAFGW